MSVNIPLTLEQPEPCTRKIRGFRRGALEVISKIARILLPSILLLFLSIVVASNNSSSVKLLPKVNCSAEIDKINIDFIRESTNTFGGIYIGVCVFVVCFEIALFILRILDLRIIEEKWKMFYYVNSVMTQIFVHLFAGGIVGIILITRFWGPYIDTVEDDGVNVATANLVYKMSLALCAVFVATYIYYFLTFTKIVSYDSRKYSGRTGCGKCDNCKNAQLQW